MPFKVLNVIGKNLNEMRRSKLSSLIIIIGPILIILLAGFVFSTNTLQGVKIGLFEDSESVLGDNLVQKFREKSFEVQEFANLESCIDSVKRGKNHLCAYIEETEPNPLGKIDPRVNNNVTLFVDYSKTRIAFTIINQVHATIEEESKETTQTILGSLSRDVSKAINEINSKEDELDEAIESVKLIQETLDNSKENIEAISAQVEQLDPTILQDINTFDSIMLAYINEIENEFGETDTTQDMRYQIEQHSQDIAAITTLIQLLQQEFNSENLQGGLATIDQELEDLLSELRGIKEGIHQINRDFDDLEGILAEEILNPIPVTYSSAVGDGKGQTEENLKFFDYILPGLITMTIMFASILLTSTLTIKERKTRAYLRSILTPTSKGVFTLGNFITALIIILIQTTILLGITKIFFSSGIALPFILTLTSILLTSSFFILTGIIIGHIFSSEETGVIASVCMGIIFLISSSMIMSIEAMPKALGSIIQFTPFVLAETALRKIAIFQLPLVNIMAEFLAIAMYIVLFIALVSILQSSRKNKEAF